MSPLGVHGMPRRSTALNRVTGRLIPALTLALSMAALGCGEDAQSPTPAEEISPALATGAAVIPLSFRQVSAGSYHSCGVTTADKVYCWGLNRDGELGDGTTTDRLKPVAVRGGLSVRTVSAGTFHTCAVTTDQRAYCWGWNGEGQLGIVGAGNLRLGPAAVAGGRRFASVRAGYHHTCGVTPADKAFCWGENISGQLGDGTTTSRREPVAVARGLAFTSVVAGTDHTCGRTTNSNAWCWGANGSGQLGNASFQPALKPALVQRAVPFSHVSAGDGHSCGVADKVVYCWGFNALGQVGDGTAGNDRVTPVPVTGGLQFATFNAGLAHNCAVTTDHRAYCWGWNGQGQLGNGQSGNSYAVPVRVGGG
jgi:alpha-tubulin suppressor-like RCC1 family protein